MNNSKRHLIIIAKTAEQEDMNFYNLLLKPDSLLFKKAIVVMFCSISQFEDYLQSMEDGYSFSLLIHVGRKTMAGQDATFIADAELIVKDLQRSELCKTAEYEFTSRQANVVYNGKPVHFTLDLPDLLEIESFPLNRKENGRIVNKGKSKSQLDFAVITALYDNEFASYDRECTSEQYKGVRNSLLAKFKPLQKVKLSYGDDYADPFLLFHQEQMGLVDAAIHATQAVIKENPTFLLMSGVCGGREGSVNRYDVIIPTEVHDYATGKFKNGQLETKGYKVAMDKDLATFLRRSTDKIIQNMRVLIDPNRKDLLSRDFKIIIDEFACGPWVVKTDGFLTEHLVGEVSKNIVGLEMESYSVLRSGELMQAHGKYSIVAKSVMDFTNEQKNDGQFGEIKASAAYVSYLCIRAMMPLLLEFKGGRG